MTLPVGKRETLLPFVAHYPGSRFLEAAPQMIFKPRGLMLWGAEELNVEAVVIGHQPQLAVSYGQVPALWFMGSQNYEQVVAAHAEGKEPGQGWGSWDDLYPGLLVRLSFDRPARGVRALMWGHSP